MLVSSSHCHVVFGWLVASAVTVSAVAEATMSNTSASKTSADVVSEEMAEWVLLGQDKACRVDVQDVTTHGRGTVQKLGGIRTLAECKARCAELFGCHGIEFNPDIQYCELWPQKATAMFVRPGWSCWARVQGVGSDCALAGFWSINDDIVARFWRLSYDIGLYEYMGRGQCTDAQGLVYKAWYAQSGFSFDRCRVECDNHAACMGFEVAEGEFCALRYNAVGYPGRAEGSLTQRSDGQGSGPVASTSAPWGRSCFKKHPEGSPVGVTDLLKQQDPGFWRVMYFPRTGLWPHGEAGTKESALQLVQSQPDIFEQCQHPEIMLPNTKAPYVQGASVWWGLTEFNAWAGVPQNASGVQWQGLVDEHVWDHSPLPGGSQCPVAKNIDHLSGQVQSVLHALWGIRSCNTFDFKRLGPEFVDLSSQGWNEVKGYGFKFGVEIFTRRLVFAHKQEITDEACFMRFIESVWPSVRSLSLSELTNRLRESGCAKFL